MLTNSFAGGAAMIRFALANRFIEVMVTLWLMTSNGLAQDAVPLSLGYLESRKALPLTVGAIELVAVTPAMEEVIRTRLPIREGETIQRADLGRALKTLREFDIQLNFSVGITDEESSRKAVIRIDRTVSYSLSPYLSIS